MEDDLKLKILAVIVIIVGILAILNSIYTQQYGKMLWFCYIGLIIIGVGILIKNPYIIASQMIITFIPSLLWIIDFTAFSFFNFHVFDITTYFFNSQSLTSRIISFEHFLVVLAPLYALYKIKILNKYKWKIFLFSWIQITIIFILTRLLTSYSDNINCAFYTCLPFDFPFPYIISWVIVMFTYNIATFLLIFKTSFFVKN